MVFLISKRFGLGVATSLGFALLSACGLTIVKEKNSDTPSKPSDSPKQQADAQALQPWGGLSLADLSQEGEMVQIPAEHILRSLSREEGSPIRPKSKRHSKRNSDAESNNSIEECVSGLVAEKAGGNAIVVRGKKDISKCPQLDLKEGAAEISIYLWLSCNDKALDLLVGKDIKEVTNLWDAGICKGKNAKYMAASKVVVKGMVDPSVAAASQKVAEPPMSEKQQSQEKDMEVQASSQPDSHKLGGSQAQSDAPVAMNLYGAGSDSGFSLKRFLEQNRGSSALKLAGEKLEPFSVTLVSFQGSNSGKACEKTAAGVTLDCLHVDKVKMVSGASSFNSLNSYRHLNISGDGAKGEWYKKGSVEVKSGGWTGSIQYSDEVVAPFAKLTRNREKVEGQLSPLAGRERPVPEDPSASVGPAVREPAPSQPIRDEVQGSGPVAPAVKAPAPDQPIRDEVQGSGPVEPRSSRASSSP